MIWGKAYFSEGVLGNFRRCTKYFKSEGIEYRED